MDSNNSSSSSNNNNNNNNCKDIIKKNEMLSNLYRLVEEKKEQDRLKELKIVSLVKENLELKNDITQLQIQIQDIKQSENQLFKLIKEKDEQDKMHIKQVKGFESNNLELHNEINEASNSSIGIKDLKFKVEFISNDLVVMQESINQTLGSIKNEIMDLKNQFKDLDKLYFRDTSLVIKLEDKVDKFLDIHYERE